jgi:hypothetical protein
MRPCVLRTYHAALWIRFYLPLAAKRTAAGLMITVFCLSYIHPALRQIKDIKFCQNYYSTLRQIIGEGFLINQTLITHMNVPGIESTYASSKEACMLMYYV